MYLINDYQIQTIKSETYFFSDNKAAKIPHQALSEILTVLQHQEKLEIDEAGLVLLAEQYQIKIEQLKKTLINQLDVLRLLAARKFLTIYINANDPKISSMLSDTLKERYNVQVVPENYMAFSSGSLVLFYRSNYSSQEFKTLYHHLPDDVYVVTAGVIHKILVIDNLYFNGCGLPTHVSNLHQLMAFLNSDLPATKDNWLLFYRSMVKNNIEVFPEPQINACQQGFIAYSLYQFISQYTHFWKAPTTLDKINWFWHVDLTSFSVHQEVSVHSAFSEYDMKLDLANLKQPELA